MNVDLVTCVSNFGSAADLFRGDAGPYPAHFVRLSKRKVVHLIHNMAHTCSPGRVLKNIDLTNQRTHASWPKKLQEGVGNFISRRTFQ